jgi:hypothetical protein
MSEDDLYDVNGWLLFYAVIRIGLAAAALIFVGAGVFATQTSIPSLRLIPVFTGLAAGIFIVRTSSWAIPAVALDMAVSLAFFVTTAFQMGLRSPAVLLQEAIQLAIFYAWFEYFRTSRRVRNTLGRNLFANASAGEDLQASSRP